ncbi:hypothetical protein [Novosphingobium mangrovi (ex Hu et al. 2023)]|uniref:Integrase n=1 Tax=Novosphingobium mangrovi (ex Hu et al. 2023) TaxID=2930094 RepID=A0ABT0A9Q7_9SPHN|nr:hypothetical protein [Novosphingobium mangrovi (ex Hu et al. 2023)]MCJ1959891.1 hypothetical protein [Novosphingobium mangrovi (ex Hu et al. 2023)]
MDQFPLLASGFLPGPKDKGGRPKDERLAELDTIAANAVIGGAFASEREAAKHYLAEYAGCIHHFDSETRNNRLRDITSRIKLRVLKLKSS